MDSNQEVTALSIAKTLTHYSPYTKETFDPRADFPVGSLCIRIFDELGTIFQDQDFADLYSQHGQPEEPPFRLALVPILQFIEACANKSSLKSDR